MMGLDLAWERFLRSIGLILLLGGFGLPVGVPPLPEDPMMANIAPEECVAYVSSAGMATPDAKSGNQTEQLLAEPEVRQMAAEIERADQGRPEEGRASRQLAAGRDQRRSIGCGQAVADPSAGRLCFERADATHRAGGPRRSRRQLRRQHGQAESDRRAGGRKWCRRNS